MPELIHTFTGGKMNKDLDERLLPNGEYRDALNLEVASSDTSQVGTFQNLKGNLELLNKSINEATGVFTTWAAADYISILSNPACIGAAADENSDEIYWFIASDPNPVTGVKVSVIASYNTVTKLTLPLVVDTKNILNFSTDYLITGINVLEGILLWTDNQTEPKKLTIKDWVNSTAKFTEHSKIYNRDFIESDLTVIKRYPLSPPIIEASSTKRNGSVDTVTQYAFTETPAGSPVGTVVPMTPESGPQSLTWQSNILPEYEQGDILILTNSENDPLDPDAIVRVEVQSVSTPQTGAVVTVLSVGAGAENQTLDKTTFDVTLEQETPFFEMRFARFGYRYKYANNELSAFSPFSNPAFIPGEFNYSPQEGYNLGMVNNIRQLNISKWKPDVAIYPDVEAVDILYKATNNANVYVVDTFTIDDPEWGADVFEIETEIITSVVNANQLLRPYDNVPRRALAQEVTANRLIYGNYTQNFNLLNADGTSFSTYITVGEISRNVSAELTEQGAPVGVSIDGEQVAESAKSIRTYQIGVAYMDEYGRTTPVFTSNKASVYIPKTNAAFSTKITAQLSTNPAGSTSLIPYYNQTNQFPYFKYYVKETSQQYYNLALDRFYNAEDGNLWLSFPSAERNKVDEETFIILKKQHDNSSAVIEKARYKIIAIENEAPQYLKDTKLTMGSVSTTFNVAGFPIEGTNEVWVLKEDFDKQFGDDTRTTSGLLLRVLAGATASSYYKITTFSVTGTSPDYIRMQSSSVFGPDMNFTSTIPYGFPNASSGLRLELARIETQNKPEFTGRFFVKVNQDALLEENILAASAGVNTSYSRKALGFLYWLSGTYRQANFWQDDWADADAQGSGQRLFIDNIITRGVSTRGDGMEAEGSMQISWSGGYGASSRERGINLSNPSLLEQLNTNNTLFRFVDAGNGIADPSGQIYQVTNTHENKSTTWDPTDNLLDSYGSSSNQMTRWTVKFNAIKDWRGLQWDPTNGSDGVAPWIPNQNNYNNAYVGIEFLTPSSEDDSFTTNNPAIFETEPKEAAELDIYYEVPGVYTKDQAGDIHSLDFFNSYSFGNGVESDRIRDDYNQPVIENGVKASATLDEPYNEEHRSNGLIFSQIFNSISGVNGLNQFIQAEGITKDVNPEYGSIQKLYARDTDLITLCENKAMKILANKDALFNADGSTNVTSNRAVLGQTITYQGEYGIGTNPESFAEFGFRMYFVDSNRGTVIRLSNDGITPVSDYGMHGFFQDNLSINKKIIGSWDADTRNYNVTFNNLTPYWQQTLGAGKTDRLNKDPECGAFINEYPTYSTTVSFKDDLNGWTSRKTYIPENGISLNNIYYTFKSGKIWEMNSNTSYNNFYGIGPSDVSLGSYYESSFTAIFNESPTSVKDFRTISYSGTDSREYIYKTAATGAKTFSLAQVQAQQLIPTEFSTAKGWYANSIVTDLQEGEVKELINKEGKYYNYIKGLPTFFVDDCDNNVDSREFNIQGIGRASAITGDTQPTSFTVTNKIDPDCFNRVPDATLQLWFDRRACDNSVQFSYVTATSATAGKCGMDSFFTNIVQQNYALSACGSTANTKYFSADGINVGTQLYNTTGVLTGFYLYRGSLNGPSDIISYYLDPTNTTYAVPDDWFLIEVDSSKMIASKTQYNTIACP